MKLVSVIALGVIIGVCYGELCSTDDGVVENSQQRILKEFDQQLPQLVERHQQERQRLTQQVRDRQVQQVENKQGPSQSVILKEFNQQLAQLEER
ncbi:hypothetical protein ACJMK2_026121 [Sinanodonta woodiana]|uniref:Uncharacterized protein n=1 Tax=Sinanodonta woodiana TaxID=1069815 RepID=A0ABD3XJ22_SINWO